MAVIRARRVNKFTVIDNKIFEAGGLSFDARGLLCTLLSKPDNWSVIIKALENETKGCRKHSKADALYTMIKELKDKGYVIMKRKATGEVDYFVYDSPQIVQDDDCPVQEASDDESPIGKIPNGENPKRGKSQTGKIPDGENPDVLINTNTTNKELIVNNNNIKNIYTPPPADEKEQTTGAKKQTTGAKKQTTGAKKQTTGAKKQGVWEEGLTLLTNKGIDKQIAKDFMIVRKAKNAPLTMSALGGLEREATKAGLKLEEVINLCAVNSWCGFKAKWLEEDPKQPQPHKPSVKDVPVHTEGGRLSW
ncbi:hypothetical protein [Snodgrassella alvi]|jgi:hypothetical protein|uniref:Phage replication protein n=1 Tax=Snodgrassella alvi TaxID=1196083 RepID=A0A855FZL8_9NEIS|nr:hypothetical protein [Snodgrassella alvi]PIT11652.1 hypothetical protein BGI30_04010 [Snodgrassella alvi]PIT55296.1 hypothetical protein BHC59_11080 [Snodgrassella alvi]PIT62566.1 hypothetical protein BHC57_01140 [Snodgrassella alvi]